MATPHCAIAQDGSSARDAIRKNAASRIVVRRMRFLLRKKFRAHGKMKRGVLEKVCRRRTAKSTRKIVVQAGFEGEVRTGLMNLDILQKLGRESGREGEGDAVFSRDF